jgi:hypothetical protein
MLSYADLSSRPVPLLPSRRVFFEKVASRQDSLDRLTCGGSCCRPLPSLLLAELLELGVSQTLLTLDVQQV